MKRILLAAAALAMSATVALADNLAGYYGNTVVTTTADGSAIKTKINKDGTYTSTLPNGTTTKGTWAWKDATTACFTQTEPAPAAGTGPACFPIDPHKVGDTWTGKAADGKTDVKYSLIAG
jgi:hypothetical protein